VEEVSVWGTKREQRSSGLEERVIIEKMAKIRQLACSATPCAVHITQM